VWSVGVPATGATLTDVHSAGAWHAEVVAVALEEVVDIELVDEDEQAARVTDPMAATTSARVAPARLSRFHIEALLVSYELIEISPRLRPQWGSQR